MPLQYDEWPLEDPFKGHGFLLQNEAHKRVWIHQREDGVWEQCTEERIDPLLEANKDALNNSAGKRWGDGQRVASMPMAWYWRNIVPAQTQGDQKYVKKILNDSDYSKFRTFGGKV